MADPTLTTGQYSIGRDGSSSAFVYGMGANNIQVASTATDTGTVNVQDQVVVGHDGTLFGIDTLPGMAVTQTGYAYTSPSQGAVAMDSYSALSGAWNDPSIRFTDGAVQVLRAFYRGSSVVRRTYGRGRKIVPTYGLVFQGLVPFTALFQSADNTWYEDVPSSVTLSITPAFYGTLTPPLTPPYQLTNTMQFRQGTATNTGTLPTWPVITFKGPITNPVLTYVATPVSIGYQGSLKNTDTLVIDTRPWSRTALLNGVSAAGQLLGSAMIAMQLQPGSTLVSLGGQDLTGSATCTITWRSATLSIGGSF
jgi:hypothetical protein